MFEFFGSFSAFSFPSWLKRTFKNKPNRPAGVWKPRFEFECLEDRITPSVTVTLDTSNLAANATAIVVNGSGFDPIVANNSIVFNDGAVGTVTSATKTSLTVTFSAKPTAGNLTVVITTDAVSSGADIQVATVV